MKKLLQLKTMLLLCALIVGSGSVWADEVTFSYDDYIGKGGPQGTGSNYTMEKTDVSITNTVFYGNSSYAHFYANGTTTITPETGVTITQVVLTASAASYNGYQSSGTITPSTGSMTHENAVVTWTGSATTAFTLSNNKQIRWTSIVVTYTPASTAALSSIKVEGTPATFCLGDAFNTTGMTVTAVLEDDTEKDVTDKADFTEPDMTSKGTKEVTVSYTEKEVTKETSYNIYVNDFTGLSLSGSYKTEFWTNEEFSHDGVAVTAEFENDNEKEIDDAVFSSPDMSSAGIKTVTVSYTIEGVERSSSYDITVSDKPQYTITWMVNGVKNKSAKITMDESLSSEFPSVSAINGKDFMGWVTTATVASDYSGGYVTPSAETATGNKTYYAVFAAKENADVTDDLTRETTGVNNNGGYSSWSEKTVNSSAVYAGQSAGDNNSIQLRSNNSNSGVVTTASGGKVKKVVVSWVNATSDGRTLNVYGKNTAYSAATDLYNASNQGTLLGTIVKGTSTPTELTIDGDYEYIGVRSNSGAMYIGTLSITWYGEVYSNYTTTPSAVGASVTIGSAGYATFVHPYAVEIPDGVEAFVVTETPTSSAKLTSVSTNIPANTPVVLKAAADDYVFDLAEGDVDAIDGNYLKVSDESTSNGVYVLANKTHGVGFYLWEGGLLGAGRVYLDVPTSAREFISFDLNDETGIEKIENAISNKENGVVFNLAGQRVAQPSKGLYIVNGRKVIVK